MCVHRTELHPTELHTLASNGYHRVVLYIGIVPAAVGGWESRYSVHNMAT